MNDQRLSLGTAPTADAGPIAIMPQRFEPFIADALDAIPPDRLPDVRLSGTPASIGAALASELADAKIEPDWLVEWLQTNISFQLRLYGQLTRCNDLKLRLEPVRAAGCPRFHPDAVRYRLLCTYRGPGTEWIDPKAVSDGGGGLPIDPARICRLDRGAIAFMRGSKGATPERPALVHRSPRLEASGDPRLLLVIDARED